MRRQGRKLNLNTDINVTSLVDVSLTLLIIFVLVAPMIKHGIEVNLPRVSTRGIDLQGQVVITVDGDNRIFFNERRISFEDIAGRLEQGPPEVVFLKADRDVSYGTIVEIMGEIKRAGIDNIGMVTEPK